MRLNPIDLMKWVDENRELLKPPVGNKVIWAEDFIVMVVGGPNERTDYHYDLGAELFYMLEGEMILRVQDNGEAKDIPIKAGEMYLLAPEIPHSPQRMPNSIGLVVERRRLPHEDDGLQWYCPSCNHKVFEKYFHLHNIELDFPPVFDEFYSSLENRTCQNCGTVHPRPQHYEMPDT